jgi:hypothetical protein
MGKMKEKSVRRINQEIRSALGEEAFEDRLRGLLRSGLVEIVSVEQDGTPNVRVTQKGLDEFFRSTSEEGAQ